MGLLWSWVNILARLRDCQPQPRPQVERVRVFEMKHTSPFIGARLRRGVDEQRPHRQYSATRDKTLHFFMCSRKVEDFIIAQHSGQMRAGNDPERSILCCRGVEMNP